MYRYVFRNILVSMAFVLTTIMFSRVVYSYQSWGICTTQSSTSCGASAPGGYGTMGSCPIASDGHGCGVSCTVCDGALSSALTICDGQWAWGKPISSCNNVFGPPSGFCGERWSAACEASGEEDCNCPIAPGNTSGGAAGGSCTYYTCTCPFRKPQPRYRTAAFTVSPLRPI
jgi:hypothetical protein